MEANFPSSVSFSCNYLKQYQNYAESRLDLHLWQCYHT